MSTLMPKIVPFKTVDANEYFYIEYIDERSVVEQYWQTWKITIKNIDTNETFVPFANLAIYQGRGIATLETYYGENGSNRKTPVGFWNYDTSTYWFGFPKNYTYNNQLVFKNGYRYSVRVDFGVDNTANKIETTPHYFSCYANFKIALETYEYNDGQKNSIEQTDETTPYELTVEKSFCKLNFSYTQEDGEQLKYYQFSLYNKDGVLLGMSKKIYGTANGIMYGIENYNNLQDYVLKLYCVTQTDRDSVTTVNIRTNYAQDNIYADISFLVDTQTAENNMSVSVVQLNGEGDKYNFESNEYVVIPDNGYVTFKDEYQVITNNFLCRMWLKNLSKNVPIMTINTADNSGRIEVFFDGLNFIAKKYSCDLVSPYITCIKDKNDEEVTSLIVTNTDIYFAIGYYNGRIEMYARLIN